MKRRVILLTGAILTFLCLSGPAGEAYGISRYIDDYSETEKTTAEMGISTATDILRNIKARDYKALSGCIHPEKGVIFSPYSYVNKDEDITLTADQLLSSGNNSKYIWGSYGEGPNPIELTIEEYFDQFVYDKDYLSADQVAVNSIIRSGNSIENVAEVFNDCLFVDFHDPGSTAYEGLDWSSLKIVLENYNGDYKVVAIIHSSYTL